MDSSFPDDPDLGIVKELGVGFGGGVEVNSMFPRWKPKEPADEDGEEVVTTGTVGDGDGWLVFHRYTIRTPPESVTVEDIPIGTWLDSEVTGVLWRIVTSARTNHGGGCVLLELP